MAGNEDISLYFDIAIFLFEKTETQNTNHAIERNKNATNKANGVS